MIDRRTLLSSGVAASAALIARARLAAAQAPHDHHQHGTPSTGGPLTKGLAVAGERYTPVVVPNGSVGSPGTELEFAL